MRVAMFHAGILACCVGVLCTAPLVAQAVGRIEGRVTTETGEGLPGVTITITVKDAPRVPSAVTDEHGGYRLAAVHPGELTVEAASGGFAPVRRSGVLALDQTLTMDFVLRPELRETMTVEAEAPLLDGSSVASGLNLNQRLVSHLPSDRNYLLLALTAPSVTTSGQGPLPSIGGGSGPENRYVIDGLDTTDPGYGTVGSLLSYEFLQEMEIKTGGYSAEYSGALGGVLNLVTKSGGNELTGDLFGYFTSDELQARPPVPETGGSTSSSRHDYGADLGGRLIRDRLWFFVAANPTFASDNFQTRQRLDYEQSQTAGSYAAKLTWLPRSSSQVVLSQFGDTSHITKGAGVLSAAGLIAQEPRVGSHSTSLTLFQSLGSRSSFEVMAGRFARKFSQQPLRDVPFYIDQQGGSFAAAQGCGDPALVRGGGPVTFAAGCRGGTLDNEEERRIRNELRAAWQRSFGGEGVAHDVQVGGVLRRLSHLERFQFPGESPGPFVDSSGRLLSADGLAGQRWVLSPNFATLVDMRQDSQGDVDESGIFVEDRLRWGRLTLNLGLRADSFTAKGERSRLGGGRELRFGHDDMLAPRLGVTLDPWNDGRTKVFAQWGRFYESMPLAITVRVLGNSTQTLYRFSYPQGRVLPTAQNPGNLLLIINQSSDTRVVPGTDPQYTDEVSLGIERELARGLVVGLRGVERKAGSVIETFSLDGGVNFLIGNVDRTYTVNPITGQTLATPITYQAVRKYQALQLTAQQRRGDRMQWFGSYVYSRARGNYAGLHLQEPSQPLPNATTAFDLPELTEGAYGYLSNDRPHHLKIGGFHRLPWRMLGGVFAQYSSGTPFSKYGPHPTSSHPRFISPRGTAGRTPDIWNVDLRLELPIALGGDRQVRLIADVFNATNNDEAIGVDQIWNVTPRVHSLPNECGGTVANCPGANPNFGNPTAFQTPRTVRFGAKLSW